MRTPSYLGYVISGVTALALLAGCSGAGSVAPAGSTGSGSTLQSISGPHMVQTKNYSVLPASHASWPQRPAIASKPFVNVARINSPMGNQIIISDFKNSNVTVFGGGGQVNAVLTAGLLNPQGMTTDASGNLYVADTGNSNVLVFNKPYTSASTTLSDSGYYPVDVSLDPSTANVGVTNIRSLSGGPGNVEIFAKGSTTPCASVGSSTVQNVYFGAYDHNGNLYVDGLDASGNLVVGVVTGGCSATTITTLLTTSNFISFPGGVQVLTNGNILVEDQTALAIYTYAPPTGGLLGSPTATTPLTGTIDPVTFAIKAFDHNLWTVDALFAQGYKYAYPTGGASIKTLANSFSQPVGVAVNPAQIP